MQFSDQSIKVSKRKSSLNSKLVESLAFRKVIKSDSVEKTMRSIDRGDFVKYDPYSDRPQTIGCNATISAPYMHAYAMEHLKDHLKRARRCLDVGSGSGYLTLALAMLMKEPDAVVYGIEHISTLVKDSIVNIQKHHKEYLSSGKIVIKEGDGRKGLEEFAPFDVIHVGAGAEVIPKDLITQLAPGGRIFIPTGLQGQQRITIIDKDENGKITEKYLIKVSYVSLTSKEKQWTPWRG